MVQRSSDLLTYPLYNYDYGAKLVTDYVTLSILLRFIIIILNFLYFSSQRSLLE